MCIIIEGGDSLIISEYNYNRASNKDKLEAFLKLSDLTFDGNIDYCVVALENNEIVGCACKDKNVFKMVAVSCKIQNEDMVSKLITKLIEKCVEENIFHYFIFTKMIYQVHFESLGFKLLSSYQEIGLFEKGNISFDQYYDGIVLDKDLLTGAIVMNCNPFTLGHRYLIEQALDKVQQLIIFVVEEDQSFFSFEDRINLVKEGTADLKNVIVIPSGPYIISQATFPTYFLKEINQKNTYYTHIDVQLFKRIMDKLNITYRFVGSEPLDQVTNLYNETMKEVLGDRLIVIERKTSSEDVISASRVRKYLESKDYDGIKDLVPDTTYQYLKKNYFNR